MKIFKRHLVTCATLLRQTRVKIRPETSQELGAEVRVVLGGVTVVAKVVVGAVDSDEVARTTIITRRKCLAGVIQQKNRDSSRMSRRKLLESLDRPTNDK